MKVRDSVALLFTMIVTWSDFSYTQEGQQTILHCFVFKNHRTDCQVNLKDLRDNFEIYRKSPGVRHLSPSLQYSILHWSFVVLQLLNLYHSCSLLHHESLVFNHREYTVNPHFSGSSIYTPIDSF